MNRTAMGLAIGAGYLLGRTRKLKLALAVGSVVAGKRLNLTPKALAETLSHQLRDNPQFKEIGDQLREDLRGVGRAATGAVVERQLDSLAGRLHGRTAQVRDRLDGIVPETEPEAEGDDDEAARELTESPRKKASSKTPSASGTAKKTAGAGKTAGAQKTAAQKTAAQKTASPARTAKKTAHGAKQRASQKGGER
ncbi:DNA primase [Streptomyces roseirectus]|uniref:DNA primase n=1 Tax=Streptomyces roseirectus TaxID=2768066 RepID=A0A7H0INL8_9ACTN|nr:DNA primase [Streptomyces roseirectus]QNP74384.1 DNA primase [Streptomyces roseirectus]